jgi:hypothetical protein
VPGWHILCVLWPFLCSVSSVKMRDDCLFCLYWWNWWPSLFKLSFHNLLTFLHEDETFTMT